MSKIREKESLECGRMHIWALKTQKLPGPLSGPWTPAANCSLRSRNSASLRRQLSASAPGPPPLTKSWIRTWHCRCVTLSEIALGWEWNGVSLSQTSFGGENNYSSVVQSSRCSYNFVWKEILRFCFERRKNNQWSITLELFTLK